MTPRHLSDLNLMVTRTCNAACDHCSVESSPADKRRMSEGTFEASLGLIEAFARVPGARRVVVTGGEPFLERERLARVVEAAHRCGLRAGVETNAHWARNLDRGRALVEEIPLDDYLLSTSVFHLRYVPFTAVEHAWRAATDAGRRAGVRFSRLSPPSDEDRALEARVRASIPERDLEIQPVAAVGRALQTGLASGEAPGDDGDDRCPGDGPLVDERGRVHPCCNALSLIDNHALEMGDVSGDAPEEILRRLEHDPLFASLRDDGIARVAARLSAAGEPVPPMRGDACRRCYDLFAAARLRPALLELRG